MVEKMRASIEALGGEIRFGCKVEEIAIDRDAAGNGQVRGVRLAGGEEIATDHVVLAVGHSARDTFEMLFDQGVYIEAKPFSIGFRIEHPQSLIDRARFGPQPGTRCSAPPTTSWCTTAPTAAPSTASACARAARWSPPPRNRGAW